MQSVAVPNWLKVEIESQECKVSDEIRNRMQPFLDRIKAAVREFPEPRLWLTVVYHPNTQRYHFQAKLKLPGHTIITGAYDQYIDRAFERCAGRVMHRIEHYKSDPDHDAIEHAKRASSLNDVIAPVEPDAGPIGEAVQNEDYAAFRHHLLRYSEWVRMRVGRWVQRFPEVQSQIGATYEISDIVEEVFLLAFDQYVDRPQVKSISEWLDSLVDPAVKTFLRDPAEAMEATSRAKSASGIND